MPSPYRLSLRAGWASMDWNGHMANTAYLDAVVDVRLQYFESRGFPPAELGRRRMGPVVRSDHLEYHREVRLLETVVVTLELAAAAPDASRFRLRNRFEREDGTLVAEVTSEGGWMDLETRRLTAPPPDLRAALLDLERTADFEELRSSVRKDG